MIWEEVKKTYPNQWVIIEAIEARTEGDKRIINQVSVVKTYQCDNNKALLHYLQLHRKHKERELYVVHTSRHELDITEEKWTGVRAKVEDGYIVAERPLLQNASPMGIKEEEVLTDIKEVIKPCLAMCKEQGLNIINVAREKNKAFEDKYGVKFTLYSINFPDDATIEQHEDFIEWEFWSQTEKKYNDAL